MSETKTRRPRKPKNWVCVMHSNGGEHVVLRSNPTDEAVRLWVAEQRRRFFANVPRGPNGRRAYYIERAEIWADETKFMTGEGEPHRLVNLDDLPLNQTASGE